MSHFDKVIITYRDKLQYILDQKSESYTKLEDKLLCLVKQHLQESSELKRQVVNLQSEISEYQDQLKVTELNIMQPADIEIEDIDDKFSQILRITQSKN